MNKKEEYTVGRFFVYCNRIMEVTENDGSLSFYDHTSEQPFSGCAPHRGDVFLDNAKLLNILYGVKK